MRVVVCLLLCGAVVSAIPAGFTTWFNSADCPSGWYQIPTTQGRLIVSVDDAAEAGITLGKPLADQEDRVHSHHYSTVLDLPSHPVAAINCCNNQGAAHGKYRVEGTMSPSTSGYPFVQLVLCTLKYADSNPVPFGTIAYFDPSVQGCPENFAPVTQANGRFLVPGWSSKGVVPSKAPALKSGEDRLHSHTFTTQIRTTDVSYVGASGCCNSNPAQAGTYNITGNSTAESSGLPYIQMLTCVSQEITFESAFPSQTLLFNQVACPPGWNVSLSHAGRFVVALPQNGLPGATFGGASLRPGFTGDVSNRHTFKGAVATNSAGVGLASGCCASGYVGNDVYTYTDVTDDGFMDMPYLSTPLCMKTV